MNQMSPVAADATLPPVPPRRRVTPRLLVMLSLPLVLLAAGAWFWLTGGRTVATDNAQVGAHVVAVSPEVAGRVVEVYVAENQPVRRGQLLYRIDPAPYRIALLQAQAAIGTAQIGIAQMQSDYSAKVATIGERGADVALARQNLERQAQLFDRGFSTRASLDAGKAALAAAVAQRANASSEAQSARAMLGASAQGGHPQVEAALAMRDKALLDLARTEIRSPIDGIVAQADKLTPGATAMQMLSNISIVGGGDYWVEANFKETQLAKLRVGQPAEVSFDAMPGRSFRARVASIGSGTGSQFALLPAQNATGNWVKVTQRVPVRLKLLERTDGPLVAGWSAHVTVRVAG